MTRYEPDEPSGCSSPRMHDSGSAGHNFDIPSSCGGGPLVPLPVCRNQITLPAQGASRNETPQAAGWMGGNFLGAVGVARGYRACARPGRAATTETGGFWKLSRPPAKENLSELRLANSNAIRNS